MVQFTEALVSTYLYIADYQWVETVAYIAMLVAVFSSPIWFCWLLCWIAGELYDPKQKNWGSPYRHEWEERRNRRYQQEYHQGPLAQSAEHPALNREVQGSKPWGPTTRKGTVKRRITWALNAKRALAYFPGDTAATKFAWAERKPGFDHTTMKEVHYEEPWTLLWDGIHMETFRTEVEAKLCLIRLVHGIESQYLIPSEILADAKLKYGTEDWVDEWYCTDQNDEIVECTNVVRPAGRKIRLGDSVREQHSGFAAAQRQRAAYSGGRTDRIYEIPARVTATPEPADEECYYVFKTGGHYDPEAKKAAAEAGEPEKDPKGDIQAQGEAAEA